MRKKGLVTLALVALAWIGILQQARPAPPVKTIQGVWLSPDWILPGDCKYSEDQVRRIVRSAVGSLKKQGINTIFMETLLRGTSIAAAGRTPIFPHLEWVYEHRGSRTLDALQILIDEAGEAEIAVHAWVHMFYWRMDNDDVFKPWQRSFSIWDDLLVGYLEQQAAFLKTARKLPELRQTLGAVVAAVRNHGVDGGEISALMRQQGYETGGHPLGRLVHELMVAGCPPPDFLLIGSAEDPFPRTPRRSLRPIYVNGAHPQVKDRISTVIAAISSTHPDLAGIHLDHVRFPTEGQGIPAAWEARGRDAVYFNMAIPAMAERYRQFEELLGGRRQALTLLVNDVRTRLHRGQSLSAAVLPLYYVERSDGTDRFNGYDYSAQDWHDWNIDFVVPMMYGFDPWRIRTLIRRYENEVKALSANRTPPSVVPGVSKLKMAQAGLLGNDDFVFFDLTLGLDVRRYEREHEEDYDWQPRKDI